MARQGNLPGSSRRRSTQQRLSLSEAELSESMREGIAGFVVGRPRDLLRRSRSADKESQRLGRNEDLPFAVAVLVPSLPKGWSEDVYRTSGLLRAGSYRMVTAWDPGRSFGGCKADSVGSIMSG